jgi:FkbH-like protein
VQTGLYGNLLGNIGSIADAKPEGAAVVLEWADLDPRLSIRRLAGWSPSQLPSIVDDARTQAERFRAALAAVPIPLAISLPNLPLPPVGHTASYKAGLFDSQLREIASSLGLHLAETRGISVVNPQRLALGARGENFDVRSELTANFPFTLPYADQLADLLAAIIRNPIPKRGLITDLDDTMWKGIVGEVSLEGIGWDLDHHAQIHGLYQQELASLAELGVLIGVASKNDPQVVEEVFAKAGLILPKSRIFPMEVNWGPKSASVSRILETWNISADSVVFVDDSPLDLAEVKAAHPGIECLRFPKQEDRAYQLLGSLRDLFGKDTISAEDSIRLDSIRTRHTVAAQLECASPESFLQQAGGKLTLYISKNPDPRAFELVNKTNQFNLNGNRYTESAWNTYLSNPHVFQLVASYEDKYGPLGKIAVLAGRYVGEKLFLDVWVMSCRAFSRRIEDGCLLYLLNHFPAKEVHFDFVPTQRNCPLRDFLQVIGGTTPEAEFVVPREVVLSSCLPFYFTVEEETSWITSTVS